MIGPRFIGLCGPKHGGKDTVAQFIIDADPRFRRVAFADVMKRMALAMDPWVGPIPRRIVDIDPSLIAPAESWEDWIQFAHPWARLSILVNAVGWEEAKTVDDVRRFLQRLGTEGGRDCIDQNIWVDTTFRRSVYPVWDPVDAFNSTDDRARFVFTDVRFTNEIEAIRQLDGEIWRIERPGVEDGDPHPSEREWREVTPDITVPNTGTLDDLRLAVTGFLGGGAFDAARPPSCD